MFRIRSSTCSASSAPSSPTRASRRSSRRGLHEYLDRLQTKMNEVGTGISETFFAARGAPPSGRRPGDAPPPRRSPCERTRASARSHGHPRRALTIGPLPLRPARRALAAGRPAAARAALPHADPELLAEVAPKQHFINWQQDPHGNYLARLVFPEKTRELLDRSRSDGRDGGLQSVRLLPRAVGRDVSVRLRALAARRSSRRSSSGSPAGPRLRDYLDGDRSTPSPHDRFPRRAQPPAGAGHQLRHPPGARRADARGDADARTRFVPRLRLAAGADPAPSRAGGALRLRLPDSAHARREVARRSDRRRRPTSPTCTPGRRSTCPAPAGSGSTRPPVCSPAKATSRSPRRPSLPSAAPVTGAVGRVRGRVRPRDDACGGSTNRRASPSRTPRSNGGRSTRCGQRRRPRAARRRRAAHDGRRADVRVDRRHGRRRVEHRRARSAQARARRRS